MTVNRPEADPSVAEQGRCDPSSMEQIGRRLRHLRETMGFDNRKAWSQSIGVHYTAWFGYEKGSRRISINEAINLATRFGISLDWIYLGKHEPGRTLEAPEDVPVRPAEGVGLGAKIKAGRKKVGMTGAELASTLGVTRQAVNSWEIGTTAPSPELLPEVCRLLGIQLDEVVMALKPRLNGSSMRVQDVLDVARNQIAQIAGAPAEAIRLKLEITS